MARAILIAVLCCGCAGSLRPTEPSELCARLDGRRQAWSMVATTSAALSGAQGLGSIPERGPTSEDTRTGLQVGAVVAATIAAGATVAQDQAAQAWARECAP